MSIKTKNYVGKSVIIKTSIYDNLVGKTATIIEQDLTILNEDLFCLDIPHPEDETTNYWINENDIIIEK